MAIPGMPVPGATPIPPQMPPGGTGSASAPQAMAGAGAQAISAVKAALEAMQKAIPGLPMGSDLHTAVLKAITDISKHIGETGGDPSGIIQQLAQLAQQQKQAPQAAAAMRPFSPVPPPGAAPAPPAA
jgi:hypothetical protein